MEINSIALNTELEKGICSSLYEIFFITNTSILLPQYLNLFIKRNEFARHCEFIGWGSAREYCRVSNIAEIEVPIPDIKVQKSIVSIYEVYQSRKKILEKLKAQIKNICPILVKGSLDEGKMC